MNTKTDISAAYVGSTQVSKLYLGNEVVWPTTPPAPVPYEQQYFTVEANEAGNFYVRSSNFLFSKNGGAWTSGTGNTTIPLAQGDKVRFKHDVNSSYPGMFSGNTMSFQVYGNIESMEYGDNFSGQTSIHVPSAFSQYFLSSTGLTSAENLVLPATTLADSCYRNMFYNCTSLTQAPALPATTLADSCYRNMFCKCTSLTQAPELPATTMANSCYQSMFQGCTSLTTTPALPATLLDEYCYSYMFRGCTSLAQAPVLSATTLASNCYYYMFSNCTSLTQAPVLPATTLVDRCYWSMFSNCTSLTQAPVLSATTLASYCYYYMFSGCTSLNTITCLAMDMSEPNCLTSWVSGVASTGTFYKSPYVDEWDWPTGTDGIPSGWTVLDYTP